jgi:hypothetical protein
MSSILKFTRPGTTFDPDTLTILGDVYDRACASLCRCSVSAACDAMAERIFAAAMRGERDPTDSGGLRCAEFRLSGKGRYIP